MKTTHEHDAAVPESGPMRAWARIGGAVIGLVGIVIAVVGLGSHSVTEAGLGNGTIGIYDYYRGREVFQLTSASAASALNASDADRKIAWLGASQLYGINQYSEGEHTAPYQALEALSEDRADMVSIAMANAFPEEFLVITTYLLEHSRMSGLIIGAVYDDMREDGVRSEVSTYLEDPKTRSRLERHAIGARILEDQRTRRQGSEAMESMTPKASNTNLMARSEQTITEGLETLFGMETIRREGRGRTLLLLSEIRRFFESLRARYTRDLSRYRIPIPADRFAANLAAWEALLSEAKRENVPVLVYVAPRPTDFFPYDAAGYADFKEELKRLTEAKGGIFLNLEDVVPSEAFGEVDITFGFFARDPFHFKAEGHAALAQAIVKAARAHLIGETR